MQTLSPQELEQARTLRLQGKSTDEVFNYIAGKRINAPSRLSAIRQEPITPQTTNDNLLADMPQDIFSGVRQLGEGYLNRFERLQNTAGAALRGEQTFGETATQLSANIAGGAIADPAFQLAKTGASLFTTPQQEQKIGEAFSQGIQTVGEKTGIIDWYSNLEPRTQRNVDAALDIIDVAPVSIAGKVKSLFRGASKVDATPKLQQVIAKAEQGDTTDAVRVANATLDETTRATEVDKLARAYQDSLVGDRVKVNRLLQEQAADMSRRGEVVTQDQLIKNLANEGVIPDVRGKLADFTTEIRNLDARQNELFNAYRPVLEASPAKASIDDFARYASRSMAESPNLRFELDKAEGQLNTIINNLRRSYGLDETGQLTASQIDDISRQANARTKAYRETDTFQADVYSELGRAARQWLNENIPDQSFRQVNDEWLRLEQIKRTAEAMQNQQVDVGILGRALGSYVTTLTGVTLGASVGNPFMAVAAGVLTKLGGDAYADALRSRTFSPEIRQMLQDRLTNDKALIAKLKETATTQENKNLYDQMSRMLPPARSEVRSEVGSGAPITATQSGASAPAGQVVEGAAPNAIQTPETGNLQPIPRALYPQMTEAELQKLNTESFRKTLENVGVSPDELKKAIAGGTVGLMLALYLNEDGSTLPAFGAIMGVMASRGGKLQMLDEAIKANNMRREAYLRAGKAENSREIKILDKQMAALAKEKARVEDSLSPGMTIKDVSGKAKGATPQTTALLEEAKKYKSAEEFVKAQGTPVYHGTATEFDSFDASKRTMSQGESSPEGFFFSTDKKEASIYAKEAAFKQGKKDGDVMEVYLSYDNPLILPSGKRTTKASNIRLAKENGHDAVIDEAGNIVVFSESQIQTKKQLIDIWKDAQS